jgi:stage III sporulation protein AH
MERISMFMVFKKKQMIMTAMVLVLGIAGYLNYRYDKDEVQNVASVTQEDINEPEVGETVMVNANATKDKKEEKDFFASEKLERDKQRAKTMDEYKKILADPDVSPEVKEDTENKLNDLISFEENEIMAQNLLSAKGFTDTLVYITDDNVTVTIKRDGISRSDTAKIVDIIYELTQNNNIKIVEVK